MNNFEHPIFNRTGVILLFFIILMIVIFLWQKEIRNIYQELEMELILVEDKDSPSYKDLIDFRNRVQSMVDIYQHYHDEI